jgi:hypothetical protein
MASRFERSSLLPDEGVTDPERIRRFDELIGYLVEHDDRGGTDDLGHEDEPFLATLARRRFPHFEITQPRVIDDRGENAEVVLQRLVGQFVDDQDARRRRISVLATVALRASCAPLFRPA